MLDFSSMFEVNFSAVARRYAVAGNVIFVCDDFLRDPHGVRDLAATLDFGIHSGKREFRQYPGERAQISLYPKAVFSRLVSLTREVSADSTTSDFVKYPVTFTRINPKLLDHLHPRQMVPHLDVEFLLV